MRDEFAVHKLSPEGMLKARRIAEAFSKCLDDVETMLGVEIGKQFPYVPSARALALVRTHMEMASFYAKKSMAQQTENQES